MDRLRDGSRYARPQHRFPIPAASGGHIRRPRSAQRHLPRRRHRQPTPPEFRSERGELHVVDIGSLNGTYVNGEPIDSAVLTNGDEIQMGKFRLVLDPARDGLTPKPQTLWCGNVFAIRFECEISR